MVTGVLADVVSADSSVMVGILYPTGHIDEPSVALQLAVLDAPSLSAVVQSGELVEVIKSVPALFISVA